MDLDQIREIVIPSDFSAATDSELDELDSMARAAAAPLAEKVSDDGAGEFSDDELDALEHLSKVVAAVNGERGKRVAAAATGAARQTRAAKAAGTFATDKDGEPESAKPTKTGVADVAAAGGTTDAAEVDADAARDPHATLVAAVGAVGVRPGEKFTDWGAVGVALEESMAAFSGLGENVFQRNPVVQVRRNYPPELRITSGDTPETTFNKIEEAAKVSRLPGGALTAAAGWCAPSQILYDLYEIENGTDGMADFPELQISRGGIQYTPGPDFSYLWGGSSSAPAWPQGYWHQTETQVQAGRTKPAMVVPCASFANTRLEVDGVQITGAFLQDRGYPELVARFSRGAMVVHNRRMNAFALNVVTDGSTLIDLTGANWPAATSTEGKDLTTVSRLLAAFGIQAMDYRYRYRMGLTDSLEVILPYWVVEPVRGDVQRRMNLEPDVAFSVAVSQLTNWFSARNMRLQLVYDWQDAFNAPTSVTQWSNTTDAAARFTVNTTTNVGSASTQIYTMPTTVFGLLYAPGTWVRGVSDVIRLDTVYDSTNLALNQYVQLFTEEGILMAKRGYESRLIKATIEPSGTVSATTSMTF